MTDATIWATIAGLGLLTYLIRVSFLGLLAGRQLPETLIRGLSFVPATVLPALVAPMLLRYGAGDGGPDVAVLAASLAALVAGFMSRSVLWGVLGGTAGYLLASLLV